MHQEQPQGWADWMHIPDSSFATGRRLLSQPATEAAGTPKSPRVIVKLLRSTGEIIPEAGANYTDIYIDSFASLSESKALHRKLLQDRDANNSAVPPQKVSPVQLGHMWTMALPMMSRADLALRLASICTRIAVQGPSMPSGR